MMNIRSYNNNAYSYSIHTRAFFYYESEHKNFMYSIENPPSPSNPQFQSLKSRQTRIILRTKQLMTKYLKLSPILISK